MKGRRGRPRRWEGDEGEVSLPVLRKDLKEPRELVVVPVDPETAHLDFPPIEKHVGPGKRPVVVDAEGKRLTQFERRANRILAMRSNGMTPTQIQQTMGITPGYYADICKKMRTSGQWVEDSTERLDRIGVPLAVDNTIRGLEKGDKKYTLEVLRGRGVLNEGASSAPVMQQMLSVRIEMPERGVVQAVEGAIVGVPNSGR